MLSYNEMAKKDQPKLILSHTSELINWWLRVFNESLFGDKKPPLYFEDGVSRPLVHYAYNSNLKRHVPVAARIPSRQEVRECEMFEELRGENGIIAYHGLGGYCREGVNYLTLSLNPVSGFDPHPYFAGNSFLWSAGEEERKYKDVSEQTRTHFQCESLDVRLKPGLEVTFARSYVLPSREKWRELMEDLAQVIAQSTLDDSMLRRTYRLAYLLQPFWLVKLALNAVSNVRYGLDFEPWVLTANIKELADTSDFSVEVQSRVNQWFRSIYGVDDSVIGQSNYNYLQQQLRLVGRMLMSNSNAHAEVG